MCILVYIYIYVYVDRYMYMYIHRDTYTHLYVYTHVSLYMEIYEYSYICIYFLTRVFRVAGLRVWVVKNALRTPKVRRRVAREARFVGLGVFRV